MYANGRAPSSAAASDGYLPAVREGLDRSRVAEVQRARLLGALVGEVAERGVASVSVAHVVARAGVSRRTFYELFVDREDCFLAAFEEALGGATATVLPAYEQAGGWLERMRASLRALLEWLDHDPAWARLLIVGSLAAGPQVLERRQSALARMVEAIDEGRGQARRGVEPPPMTAEGVLGGILSILHARLSEKAPPRLVELSGPLMAMIALPYLGAAAASREAARPAPKSPAKRPALPHSDPLQGLDMRLTYRTIRVLSAVAQSPGSSNRAVGTAAEIGDQGQVSKLLARLQRVGLVENKGEGAATRGEPNAWRLTDRGSEVHATIAGVAS
ncbi:MAG: TetR/AcrR family transcriptional regulator [Solirubrobacteraceae bacterium]